MLYVDDCCIMYDESLSGADYRKFLADLAADFKYTGGDDIDFFLGFKVTRDRTKNTVVLDQKAFIQKAIEAHGMSNAHPVDTPIVPGQQLGHVLRP